MLDSPDECAHEILDVVPLVMRSMRAELRSHRSADLSVPEYRSLALINRRPGASLSNVAKHLGLTLPSTSKLVDGLVDRQLVTRQLSTSDRRRITLNLTESGKSVLEASYQITRVHFSEVFTRLPEADRALIIRAMQVLRSIFSTNEALQGGSGR